MIAAALRRYLLPAEILAVLALLGGLLYGVHLVFEHQRDIGRKEVRGEWGRANLAGEKAAAEKERLWQGQVNLATKGGNDREEAIKTMAGAASGAAVGLRNATAEINRALSGYSADALRSVASAYGDVFTECQDRRRELATESERLNSEKQTLIEAWPK